MRRKVPDGRYLVRDLCIVVLSVIIAILLVRVGYLEHLFVATEEAAIISSLIAGIFFTSAFTIAPASIALAELTSNHSVWLVALFGALGAMVGDIIIFLFIRDSVTDDINYIIRKIHIQRWLRLFHLGFLRVLTPILGALIIASPLPDELGIAMMGISQMRTRTIIPIAFVMNFIGILLIAGIASALR